MAKVELVKNGDNPFLSIGYAVALEALPARAPVMPEHDEYADKVWLEFQAEDLVNQLIAKRKGIQHKLDAARKRLKRVTNKLNLIEDGWIVNSA